MRRAGAIPGPSSGVCLSREEAAASLGISLDSFERYVQADLRLIRRGRMVLIDVAELRAWAADAGERTLG